MAEAAKDLFGKYYDTFMPLLMLILEQAVDAQHRVLRGKAMECISLICYVVGPEKSRMDALKTMQILVRTPADQMSPDDPQVCVSMLQRAVRVLELEAGTIDIQYIFGCILMCVSRYGMLCARAD